MDSTISYNAFVDKLFVGDNSGSPLTSSVLEIPNHGAYNAALSPIAEELDMLSQDPCK